MPGFVGIVTGALVSARHADGSFRSLLGLLEFTLEGSATLVDGHSLLHSWIDSKQYNFQIVYRYEAVMSNPGTFGHFNSMILFHSELPLRMPQDTQEHISGTSNY